MVVRQIIAAKGRDNKAVRSYNFFHRSKEGRSSRVNRNIRSKKFDEFCEDGWFVNDKRKEIDNRLIKEIQIPSGKILVRGRHEGFITSKIPKGRNNAPDLLVGKCAL